MALKDRIQQLWVRLLTSHIAVALVPALLIGGLVLRTAQGLVRDTVLQTHQEVARRAAEEIAHFVGQPISRLSALALSLNVERAAWPRQSLLSQARLEMEGVDAICLIDTNGYIQATSVLDRESSLSQGHFLPAEYLPDPERLWRMVSEGKPYLSNLMILKGQPVLVVGLPVREGRGLSGALITRLNLYSIWDKLDHIRFGETGHSALVDAEGRLLAHPERERVFQQQRHAQARSLQGRATGILQWRDDQRIDWVAGFATVASLRWKVVVEQPTQAAFRPLALLHQRALLIVLGSMAGAIGLGLVLLRTITRPLDRLMEAVRRAQAGDVDLDVLPKGRDEFRVLGEAFIAMSRQLAGRRRELEAMLAFERHLIADNPLGMAVLDADYRIVQANRVWMETFHADKVVGERLTAWKEGGQLQAWLEAHPDRQGVDRLPIQGGDDRLCFWSLRIVTLPATYPGERLVVLEDETQQRLLEQQLLQADKLTSLGEMAAGVAHEIKNPLAIMQNACDLLKRLTPEKREAQEQAIGILEGAIQRVNGRIGDLLDFARPGRQVRESVELVALLRQLLELEHQQLQEAGVQVHEDLEEVPRVYMNLDLLKDLCLNLLTNAREAMPEGGELTVATRRAGTQVLLQVRDTGTGIAPEHRDRIFEPFYSTKPTGYGLGLAIAHRQLQEIGGRIEVESREGMGSTFSVYLPTGIGKEE